MKLDTRALTLAVAIITGVAYLLCAGLVAIAPHGRMVLFATMTHADLGAMSWTLGWGTVGAGLVLTTGFAALAAALVGATYNLLVDPASAEHTGTRPAAASR